MRIFVRLELNSNSLAKCTRTHQMNIFLNAFSFEQDPHIIVVTQVRPLGATAIKIDCNRFGQSSPGNAPSAGRLTNAKGEEEEEE